MWFMSDEIPCSGFFEWFHTALKSILNFNAQSKGRDFWLLQKFWYFVCLEFLCLRWVLIDDTRSLYRLSFVQDIRGSLLVSYDIKNNAWVAVNNDFLVMSGVICQWFSRVMKSRVKIIGHSWKSLANHLTSDQKSLFTVTNVLIYFLLAIFFILNIPFRYKQSSIAHFAIVARDGLFWLDIVMSSQLICDVTRTRGTGIVT